MKRFLLILLPFLVLYMAFAFVNWDIAWVAHVEMIARWFFILLFVAFILLSSRIYFENEDKF